MAEKRAVKDSEINQTGLAACSDHYGQSWSLEIPIVCPEEPPLTTQFRSFKTQYLAVSFRPKYVPFL